VATLPKIETFLDLHAAPFIAKVYSPSPSECEENPGAAGRVALWYPKS